MNHFELSLEQLLDLEKWQPLQDALAQITGLAIITVNYDGRPITQHSGRTAFCSTVRRDASRGKYCQICDARGGLEAMRENAPYFYYCHYQLLDFAVPIHVDNHYVGAVLAGQVKLSDPDSALELEHILPNAHGLPNAISESTLFEHYETLSIRRYQDIKNVADMLFILINYLVDVSANKYYLISAYDSLFHNDLTRNILAAEKSGSTAKLAQNSGRKAAEHGPAAKRIELAHTGLPSSGPPLQPSDIRNIRETLSGMMADAYLSQNEDDDITQHRAIKVVFHYMDTHKSKKITLAQMADLCHLSPGYLSRVFLKETGEPFSSYVARSKIGWSTNLLERTDLPIAQIAEALGFSDATYFIRTFKKYCGVTPAVYRKYRVEERRRG